MTSTDLTRIVADRLDIARPNPMQLDVWASDASRLIVLAPTGSGKTVAFVGAMLRRLQPPRQYTQALILAPSRELVLQIFEVTRKMCTGYKVSAFYGKHSMEEEKASLAVAPDIIVATPGRMLDHLKRNNLTLDRCSTLVVDEYDKALELGFHDEMSRICRRLKAVKNVILTSATPLAEMPDFIDMRGAQTIDYAAQAADVRRRMQTVRVESPVRDKLQTLVDLLNSLPQGKVIVFVNHREAAERVYNALKGLHMPAALYHGGLEQIDREGAVIQFNNGSAPILVATDLGARGLDIDSVGTVVHYHLPSTPEAWTHRNGRTARVDATGTVYVITADGENIPDYVEWQRDYCPTGTSDDPIRRTAATLYINAGRKEKISRGDIVGFLTKDAKLDGSEIGKIDLRDHASYVAIPPQALNAVFGLPTPKIKGKRVRLSKFK